MDIDSNSSAFHSFPALLFFLILAFSAATKPENISIPKRQTATEDWREYVQNVHGGLVVESVRLKNDKAVEVRIKNGYQKDITAIAFRYGGYRSKRVDYSWAALERLQKIASGASDEFIFQFYPDQLITISAIYFADGTSEGDRQQIEEILDKRLGLKTQLARIAPYWRSLEKANDRNLSSRLARMRVVTTAPSTTATNSSATMRRNRSRRLRTASSRLPNSTPKKWAAFAMVSLMAAIQSFHRFVSGGTTTTMASPSLPNYFRCQL